MLEWCSTLMMKSRPLLPQVSLTLSMRTTKLNLTLPRKISRSSDSNLPMCSSPSVQRKAKWLQMPVMISESLVDIQENQLMKTFSKSSQTELMIPQKESNWSKSSCLPSRTKLNCRNCTISLLLSSTFKSKLSSQWLNFKTAGLKMSKEMQSQKTNWVTYKINLLTLPTLDHLPVYMPVLKMFRTNPTKFK